MNHNTIQVNDHGIRLAYYDTGAPSGSVYTTIVAIHGIIFNNKIFRKIADHAFAKGVRFVAVNRRDYGDSTPFTDDEKVGRAASSEKSWLQERGEEFARFLDIFIQKERLPEVSTGPNGAPDGGVVLLGWSMGSMYTNAAISSVVNLDIAAQQRLAAYLRGNILLEPPPCALGKSFPPKTYLHELDTCIEAKARVPSFTRFLTYYFKHANTAARDPEILEYVVPALDRIPSIWNMSEDDKAAIIQDEIYTNYESMLILGGSLEAPATDAYKSATFNKAIKEILPHFRSLVVCGDATAALCIAAFWDIQDDDRAYGSGYVESKLLAGGNHCMHWDDAEKTFEIIADFLAK